MNPKGYGDRNAGVQAQDHEGPALRPHFLGITLCASRLRRTNDRTSHPVLYVAYFSGIRSLGSRPQHVGAVRSPFTQNPARVPLTSRRHGRRTCVRLTGVRKRTTDERQEALNCRLTAASPDRRNYREGRHRESGDRGA